jgi:hypothetical protein
MAINTNLPYWKSTLPKAPQKGYNESIGINVIRSPMDSGPAKMRRRSKRPDQLDLTYIMTDAQVEVLRLFIESELGGVRRFNYPHPRLSTYATTTTWKEVRIVPTGDGEFFKIQYIAPGYWSLGLKIEVLP